MTPSPEHENQNQDISIEDKFNALKEEYSEDSEEFRQNVLHLLRCFPDVCDPSHLRATLIKRKGDVNSAFTLLALETGELPPKKSKRIAYKLEDKYPEDDDETRTKVNHLMEIYENFKSDFLRNMLVNEFSGDLGETAEWVGSHEPQPSWFESDVEELGEVALKNGQYDRKGKKRDLGELVSYDFSFILGV